MVDAAGDALGDFQEHYLKVRKSVSADMTEWQNANSGEQGDRAISYRQKDHWAFLDMITLIRLASAADLEITKQMADRICDLEQLVAAMPPHASTMKYLGVWKDQEYHPGEIVTHSGSAWHCDRATTAQPGRSSDWTLMVKKGRDAKDQRGL